MLTSAKLLHFGGFHNCTLLLAPAALGQPGCPTPGKVPGSLSTAGWLWWASGGIFVLGHPKGHYDPTSSIKHQQKTGKSSFWKPKLPFPPAASLNPKPSNSWDQRNGWCSPQPWMGAGIASWALTSHFHGRDHGSHRPPLCFLHTCKKEGKEL